MLRNALVLLSLLMIGCAGGEMPKVGDHAGIYQTRMMGVSEQVIIGEITDVNATLGLISISPIHIVRTIDGINSTINITTHRNMTIAIPTINLYMSNVY